MIDQDDKEIPPYVPSEREQKDIDYALKFKKEAYQNTRQERQEWRNSYWRYKLARKLSDYDYVDDVQLGLTYDSVERLASALPGREFGFKAYPVGAEDTKNAILFSEVLNHAWQSPDIMDGPNKMDVIKKNISLFGNCFAQVYWETKFDEDGNVVKNDPCFWPLNLFDVYYNKFVAELRDLPEIGYQSIVSLNWLKKNGKQLGYKNTKYVKGFSPKRNTGMDEDSGTIDSEETQGGKSGEKNDLVRIFEIQSDDKILTLALDDGQTVWLRKTKNQLGRKNIVLFRFKRHPLPNRLLGVTDITKGGHIEDAIQRVMNQSVFNTLLVDNPNFTFDATDRYIDPRTFVTAPGAGIPRGKDPNSITPLTFPSHLNDSLVMYQNLMERYKKVVNTPDILQGTAQGNTATSDALNDQNAKTSIEKVVDSMKSTMVELGYLLRDLYKQYGPESLTVNLRTPELIDKIAPQEQSDNVQVEMPIEDFVLERDIDIQVEFTSQNKAVLSRRLVEWLSLTAKDTTISPQLRLRSYQKWLEFNDLDDLALEFQDQAQIGQTSDLSQADQENQQMAQGQELPPTPNASPAHTQRHVDFMRRAETGPDIDRLLQAHIEGEIQALQAQGGQQPGMGAEGGAPMQPEAAPMQTAGTSPFSYASNQPNIT